MRSAKVLKATGLKKRRLHIPVKSRLSHNFVDQVVADLIHNHQLYSHGTVINFINDISVCPEDILELLYQHDYL
jgi:hypothetical protein